MAAYADDMMLFRAFQDGETGAEKIVFQRYFKPVCIYAERITGDRDSTEDIVIESFQRAWERRLTFPTIDDFRRFLYRIVTNACLTRNTTRRQHELAHGEVRHLNAQDQELGSAYEREALRAELLQEIYLEVEGLPERCRTIFKAIFNEGLSHEQVAERLGIDIQTVRSQKARAIGLIRTRLLRRGQLLAIFLFYRLIIH
jgi:RNA polymerase sigma factor (sigma-70 family)